MLFELRPWAKTDVEHLVLYANNSNIARFMTNQFPHPYTAEAAHRFIEMTAQHSPTQIFAIDINSVAIGGIGIHPQTDIMCKNAELGYWLGEPFWGKGIITAAVREMVNYGFDTFEITRIFARPFGNNLASQKVLEKVGFQLEARITKNIYKDGIFIDELIYAIRHKI
ncbi:MAG: GNAT family N-acetyltransferase [Saprospiraceae bacterium]|nr:GNAT family N-acetyltransferase [Saprospiraceae bacterium]MBP7699408.1 GNAT family N-acetyltransferase [Saprospiraceae bacterium]